MYASAAEFKVGPQFYFLQYTAWHNQFSTQAVHFAFFPKNTLNIIWGIIIFFNIKGFFRIHLTYMWLEIRLQ